MPDSARPPLQAAVQFFATCIVEHVRPAVGLAAVRVLERLGLDVQVPAGQTCCGQPAFNAGARRDATQMARQTIDVLSRSDLPVVIPSGSCTDMIAHQYPALLADDAVYAARATALAARTWEFSEAVASLDPAVGPSSARRPVTYHPSCHLLRGLHVKDEPVRLLDAAVEGARVTLPGAEECCGFGGLFSIKMSEISSAMLARKLDHVHETGASTLVACDASCLLHLEGGLRKRGAPTEVRHLAEVLDGCAELARPASSPKTGAVA
jgi:L-lactate dehydrogenase complex protein LldE